MAHQLICLSQFGHVLAHCLWLSWPPTIDNRVPLVAHRLRLAPVTLNFTFAHVRGLCLARTLITKSTPLIFSRARWRHSACCDLCLRTIAKPLLSYNYNEAASVWRARTWIASHGGKMCQLANVLIGLKCNATTGSDKAGPYLVSTIWYAISCSLLAWHETVTVQRSSATASVSVDRHNRR